MIRVSVLYPNGAGTRFDHDDYETRHRRLVMDRLQSLGLLKIEMERGVAGLDGAPAPFIAAGALYFKDLDAFGRSMETHGEELLGDVPNFTDAQPTIQVSEVSEALAEEHEGVAS